MDPIKLWRIYGAKLKERFAKDRSAKAFRDVDSLPEVFIYRPNPSFTDWIIRSYIRDGIHMVEDIPSRVYPALASYDLLMRNKARAELIVKAEEAKDLIATAESRWVNPKRVGDINRFCGIAGCRLVKKQLSEEKREMIAKQHPEYLQQLEQRVPGLSDFIDEYKYLVQKAEAEIETSEEDKKALIYEDATCKMYHPQTEAQSCRLGRGTRWCTAARDQNMFEEYDKAGNIYIIVPKIRNYPKEKYQIHHATGSFMDDKDEEVQFEVLLSRFPGAIDYVIKPLTKTRSNGNELFVYDVTNEEEEKDYRSLIFYLPQEKRVCSIHEVVELELVKILLVYPSDPAITLYRIGESDYCHTADNTAYFILKKEFGKEILIQGQKAIYYDFMDVMHIRGNGMIFHLLEQDMYITDHEAIDRGIVKPYATGVNFYALSDNTFYFYLGVGLHNVIHSYYERLMDLEEYKAAWAFLFSPEGLPIFNDFFSTCNTNSSKDIERDLQNYLSFIHKLIINCKFYITGYGYNRVDFLCHYYTQRILYFFRGQVFDIHHPPTELKSVLRMNIETELVKSKQANGIIKANYHAQVFNFPIYVSWNKDLTFVEGNIVVLAGTSRKKTLSLN
jgi:hypothetical protein